MEFRDLGAQYEALKEEMDEAILSTVADGRFIGGGPVAELERRLAEYVGVRHCITCANGTDALQLALMAWGVGSGDAVFVPDFTFFSTGEVVSAVGATPVFVDVCEDTFNMDPVSLRNAYDHVVRHTGLRPRAAIPAACAGCSPSHSPSACDRRADSCRCSRRPRCSTPRSNPPRRARPAAPVRPTPCARTWWMAPSRR